MTAEEKADEIIEKVANIENNNNDFTTDVKMALIVVDEIIKQLVPIERAPNNKSAFQYWEEVKQEIEFI